MAVNISIFYGGQRRLQGAVERKGCKWKTVTVLHSDLFHEQEKLTKKDIFYYVFALFLIFNNIIANSRTKII